ncbi:hypothetical protein CAMGR0001_1457 [Campylobacter gracilis RM3268]|uniref:Uncharacterized protein n=1 Tax=Campylobacter gracilis RM3268 TaxID=553220 RepID=C8PJQ7_9BACT|nr:hypothetical protein CAMGR0001_1457 [Campylobacter gracilis RM3268]
MIIQVARPIAAKIYFLALIHRPVAQNFAGEAYAGKIL